MKAGFQITFGTGFQVTFENGWKISVQFGPHNYSDARNMGLPFMVRPNFTGGQDVYPVSPAGTAEIAVITPAGEFFNLGGNDDVLGWQTPEDVLKVMNTIAKKKPYTEEQVKKEQARHARERAKENNS